MGSATSDTVNFASSYKVRRSHNGAGEGIQHIRLDLGVGSAEAVASGTLPVSGSVTATGAAFTLRYDEGETYTYVGEADPGIAEGSAAWRIKRLTNADNTVLWAGGDTNFDKIWTNRASLTYS